MCRDLRGMFGAVNPRNDLVKYVLLLLLLLLSLFSK